MAEHTIVVSGLPSSGTYYRHYARTSAGSSEISNDCTFTFNLPDLTGATIKKVTFSASVSSQERDGSYGDFSFKFSGTTLGQWVDSSYSNRAATGLSIVGGSGKTAEFECKHSSINHGRSYDASYSSRTGATLSNPQLTIVFDGELTETTIAPLSGEKISSSQSTEFSWNLASYSEVVSQSLFWKKSTDVNYTEISLAVDQTSYTFPGGTFDNGTIQWYVSAEDVDGNVVESGVETVDVGIVPSVEIAYPIGVNIKSSNIQIFTWEMHEDVPTGQYSYEIQYKESEDADWTVVTGTSSNQYHSFPADTFSAGEYQWKLKVTNNDGLSSEYVNSTFTAIGATDAPVITSVTNSSIPTITWTVTSQDTFEVEIYKGQERIYTSGVQVGYDVRSFTPNIMLDDGNYIIKMRAMNQYGFFTPWLDYSFVLDPEHPDALTCYAYANDHHGVTIARSLELDPVTPDTPGEPSDVPDAHYVIRRVHGETTWKIIGKLDILDESVKFEDNTVLPNVAYDYAIRNYASGAGFTDSNVVTITISFQEYILSSMTDGNKFVLFYRTEDQQFDMSHGSSKNQSYSYMIGRKYPVRESSEWLAHNDSFSCFVSFEEYERLLEFYSGNDDLWFRGKNFTYQCSIDELSIKDAMLGDGYTLGISVSRTDEEELRLF